MTRKNVHLDCVKVVMTNKKMNGHRRKKMIFHSGYFRPETDRTSSDNGSWTLYRPRVVYKRGIIEFLLYVLLFRNMKIRESTDRRYR